MAEQLIQEVLNNGTFMAHPQHGPSDIASRPPPGAKVVGFPDTGTTSLGMLEDAVRREVSWANGGVPGEHWGGGREPNADGAELGDVRAPQL
eukprot:1009790-Prorocentrum_minimum.AAC.2